jgi:hypothetical protein
MAGCKLSFTLWGHVFAEKGAFFGSTALVSDCLLTLSSFGAGRALSD